MISSCPAPEAERLRQEATRLTTPCGEGELVWHRWGDAASGPPVVLLHGGSGSWNHWVRNLQCLREAGRVVLAPDMPGFGDSAAPPDGHDADVLPRWLERGLRDLIAQARVDLVGFSFGGLVATLWAHEVPARVNRLVLVGAPALSGERQPALPLRPWHTAAPGAERLAAHRHNLLQMMLAHDEAATEETVVLHAHNVERDRMRRRRLMKTDLLARTLPAIRCPVYGIWGAEDSLFRGRIGLLREVLPRAPGFRRLELLEGAGHWVPFEAAADFNRLLLEMLAEPLDARGRA